MKLSMPLRLSIILAACILTAAYLLPSFTAIQNSSLQKYMPEAKVSLGLDLMGGIYLTLEVEVDKAVENSLLQSGQEIRNQCNEQAILITQPRMVGNERLEFILPNATQASKLEQLYTENFQQFNFKSQRLGDGSLQYTATITPERRKQMEGIALDSALKTIRSRIDEFGVAEPDIRKQEEGHRIIVQLPGLKDTKRAIQIIDKTAHLEFRISADPAKIDPEKYNRGIIPYGTEEFTYWGNAQNKILLEKNVVLTGEYIEDAYQSYDDNNKPCVAFSLNKQGAKIFERITSDNPNRLLAIILDGRVHSAPQIGRPIAGGRASITGNFTIEQANDLALVLKSGSLPAPVKVLEERTVGPSLGQESIDKGVTAALIGWVAVVAFIIIYYNWSGLIASSMMALDVVMLLAAMAALGATLTLPGIAGIVLTIGMAVDANVLIFERIREEISRGLTPLAAVNIGFSKATTTIVDSNLTTIIAAVILYQFGTGPVRGFAVTLTLGIIISMFTAIFVSRTIFDLWITKNSTKISI